MFQLAKIKAVDLFSGCGGMSLGFSNGGFDVQAAFECWEPAIAVYRRNFDHPIHAQDLSDSETSVELIRSYSPNVIFGGPPCQDFSSAGHRDETRGRAVLSIVFAQIVLGVKPQWFVMENVARIEKSNTFQELKSLLMSSGYGLTSQVLNAAHCGVPQARKRMFLIGGLGEKDGFLDAELNSSLSKHPMTVRDYLGDQLGVDHYFRVPRNYNRRGVYSIDEPSPTIRTVNRPIPPGYGGHPKDSAHRDDVRILTSKERSLIQTFPKEFEFFGSKSDMETMIGNAVPVNLARFVASALMRYIYSQDVTQ